MYTKNIIAASALLSMAAAVPMAKRDIVWVTETEEAVVTVPVTATVWVNPGEAVPTTEAKHFGHHSHHSKFTSHVQSTVTVPSSPAETSTSSESSSSSTYVAPSSYEAPSSSSVYVAPTTSSAYVAPTTSSVYVAPTTSSVYVAPTTSSVYVAPTTSSTSEYVAPTSTSTWAAPSSTSSAPAASSSAAGSTGDSVTYGPGAAGTSYSGDLTYYAPGLGSCGVTSKNGETIVAMSHTIMEAYSAESAGNPNNNPLCFQGITITGVNGQEYPATIVDTCPGCDEGALDLTEDFFNVVTNNGDGRVHNIKWRFN